jgi:hypothetical protein
MQSLAQITPPLLEEIRRLAAGKRLAKTALCLCGYVSRKTWDINLKVVITDVSFLGSFDLIGLEIKSKYAPGSFKEIGIDMVYNDAMIMEVLFQRFSGNACVLSY